MSLLLFCTLLFVLTTNARPGSVTYNNGAYQFHDSLVPNAVVTGDFEDRLDSIGWGILRVKSHKPYSDLVQMYAAGYLEGYMTNERIVQTAQNIYGVFWTESSPPSPLVLNWLKIQDTWVRDRISAPYHTLTPTWKSVAGILAQYDGMVKGFLAATPINATKTLPVSITFAFQMLAGWGDLLDLVPAMQEERRPKWSEMTAEEAQRVLGMNGHCSALVKLLGDFSDLFMGQSAWFTYGAMNRIYKHYYFDTSIGASRAMSFSSYPGSLASQDDFYLMDSGLVMLQTTNGILNSSLYKEVSNNALLAWQRVRLANQMATDGKSWCSYIQDHNSGTYNNQYMVINTNLFSPGMPIKDGFMWVAEQIPGYVEAADVTHIVKYGYWPSYNIPYFKDIWVKSGYGMYGPSLTHELAPRANIFRRDQATVVNLDSFKKLMRYNDYKHDPYAKGDPGNAVCSRFDLEAKNPAAAGCYDTKVSSFSMAKKLTSDAINGPTTSHDIPPFVWTSEFSSVPHDGQPKLWDFSFVTMDPNWN